MGVSEAALGAMVPGWGMGADLADIAEGHGAREPQRGVRRAEANNSLPAS